MGSFSILFFASSARASSLEMPTGAVTRGIFVMTSLTGRVPSSSKRRSRLVMIPSSIPSSSTTGSPDTRYWAQASSTSWRLAPGPMVTGWVTIPASERFTWSTMCAWASTDRLRCRIPIPPSRAMAMAMRVSVTVSMAAEDRGTFNRMLRLNQV